MYMVYRDYADTDNEDILAKCIVELIDDADNTVETYELLRINDVNKTICEESEELEYRSTVVGKQLLEEYGLKIYSIESPVYNDLETYIRHDLVPDV